MAEQKSENRLLSEPKHIKRLFYIKLDYGDMVDKFKYLTESELDQTSSSKKERIPEFEYQTFFPT